MKKICITLLMLTLQPVLQGVNPALVHKSTGLPSDWESFTKEDLHKIIPVLKNVQVRMDDWPQLEYYRKDNERRMQVPVKNSIVFLGDSIFELWGDPKFGGFFPGKPYINRGICAQTTPQMVLRLRADVIKLKPKALILLAGVNDIGCNTGPISLEETQDNIATIAELATIHGIKVVLCSALPTSNYHFNGLDPRGPQSQKRPNDKICALNAWIKAYSKKIGFLYIDFHSAMVDSKGMLKRELSEDDVHPNTPGYKIMKKLTEEAIAKLG